MGDQAVIHLRPRTRAPAEPVLLTIEEAAARLRVSKRTMERWVAAGSVPHVRPTERLVRIPVDLLDAWWRRRLEGDQ